jgi:hypothetical protein
MNTEPPASSTPLLDAFLKLLDGWAAAFCQHRTHQRAIRIALAHVLTPSHRLISRLITSCGRQERDWSADYKLFSRSPWLLTKLFAPVLAAGLRHTAAEPFIHVAGDMTHVRKTGKKIPGVHCMRDPMSPPFHVNLIYGLRFLQFTLVAPLYKKNPAVSPRSIPVLFEEVPALAKPGKKATDEEKQTHAQAKKQPRAMLQTVVALKGLRRRLDDEGCTKPLVATLDGGFCNRTLFGAELERTELICRARSLYFANSSAIGWTGTLSIWNWNGTNKYGTSYGAGDRQIFFGNSASGLTETQLSNISFYSDSGSSSIGTAFISSTGEIAAVPEPGVYATAALLLTAMGYQALLRRRRANHS